MVQSRSIVWRILGLVFLASLLILGGAMIFQAGQTQGYAQGLAVGRDEPAAANVPLYPVIPISGSPFFLPGLVVLLLGGLVFLVAVGFLFRPWSWHARYWRHPWWGQGAAQTTSEAREGQPGYWHGFPHPWGPPPWAQDKPDTQMGSQPSDSESEKS